MNPSNQVSQRSHNGPGSQVGQYSDYNAGDDSSQQGRGVASAGQRLPTAAPATIVPPVDIFEDDAGFTVIADMPGVSRERLEVHVSGDSLVIEGAASAPVVGNMELLYGEAQNPLYRRSFTLSRELDPARIDAKLSNGVLRLHIPKAEEAKPRRISVKVD